MKKTFIALCGLVASIPSVYAAPDAKQGITTIGVLIKDVTDKILTGLITLFATAALVAFFFGMVKFILASREGQEGEITKGKQFMLWSVIALFVMFSIWGIVNYAQTIFGVTDNTIKIPKILLDGQNAPAPTSPGLPTPAPVPSSTPECQGRSVGAVCTINGAPGHCEQGIANQNATVFCQQDARPGTAI